MLLKMGRACKILTYLNGPVLNCAEDSEDMYAFIDVVTDCLAYH